MPIIVRQLGTHIGGYKLSEPATDSINALVETQDSMAVLSRISYAQFAAMKERELLRLQQFSGTAGTPDQLARWVRWLLTDPESRTVSPTSEATNRSYTEYLLDQQGLGSAASGLASQSEQLGNCIRIRLGIAGAIRSGKSPPITRRNHLVRGTGH